MFGVCGSGLSLVFVWVLLVCFWFWWFDFWGWWFDCLFGVHMIVGLLMLWVLLVCGFGIVLLLLICVF